MSLSRTSRCDRPPSPLRHGRFPAWLLLPALFSSTRLISCGNEVPSSERACLAAVDAGSADGATLCEQAYIATGEAKLAILSAESLAKRQADSALLALARRLGDAPAAAPVWHRLGNLYEDQDRSDDAIGAYRRALARRRPDDKRGAAEDAHRVCRANWVATRYREALEYATHAEALAREAGERHLRWKALSAMFTILFDIGDQRAAERVLSIARGVASDTKERAWIRFYDGLVATSKNRPQLARLAYEETVALALPIDEHKLVRDARMNLVEVHLTLGDPDGAERALLQAGPPSRPSPNGTASMAFLRSRIAAARGDHRRALQEADKGMEAAPPSDWIWQLEALRGAALVALDRPGQAEEAYERSVHAVEALRREMGFDELKSWLQSSKRQPYEALFALQARAGRVDDALQTMQLATARTFFDVLVARGADEQPRAAPAADEDLAYEAIDRAEALRKFLPTTSRSGNAQPTSTQELLAAIRDRTVLAYFRSGESLWLAALGFQQARLVELSTSRQRLESLISQYRSTPDDHRILDELGAALLPAEVLPPTGIPVYVAADGVLGLVSFAMLRRRGAFLVELYRISYLPGLSSAVAMSDAGRSGERAAILGNPTGDLPAAAEEARFVAKELGTTPLLGRDATRGALRAAHRTSLLHVAGHAGVDRIGSYLALSDGMARSGEIIEWQLAPDVAVIASCSSAARPGDDLWTALAGAFITAGTHSVVAALWSIDDAMTSHTIHRFYERSGAVRPSSALADVQREQIANGIPPSHWGSFVVIGDLAPPENGKHPEPRP